MSFSTGSLVKARGREWVVLPESQDDFLLVRPLGGTDAEIAGIDTDHPGLQLAHKHVHHQIAFVQAQQAVVDEHAGELLADGTMEERSGHGRIHAS